MSLSTIHYPLSTINHHALFFERKNVSLDKLKDFIETKLSSSISANPDVLVFEYDKLLIEDARLIKERTLSVPVKESQLHILVSFWSADSISQNALLKTFEEPSESVCFYVLAPRNILLPTLFSRMVESREIKIDQKNKFQKEAESFLRLSIGKKNSYAESMADKYKNEEISKEEVEDFLMALHEELLKDVSKNTKSLESIAVALNYLPSHSASVKQLLSLVALS